VKSNADKLVAAVENGDNPAEALGSGGSGLGGTPIKATPRKRAAAGSAATTKTPGSRARRKTPAKNYAESTTTDNNTEVDYEILDESPTRSTAKKRRTTPNKNTPLPPKFNDNPPPPFPNLGTLTTSRNGGGAMQATPSPTDEETPTNEFFAAPIKQESSPHGMDLLNSPVEVYNGATAAAHSVAPDLEVAGQSVSYSTGPYSGEFFGEVENDYAEI